MNLPAPSPLISNWNLREDIVFLNHGSFGATPRYVLDQQRSYIDQLEAEPVEFSVKKWYALYRESKLELANFVGTSENNIYFVPNTTIGVNHVLHNIQETHKSWLTTNHAYGACIHAFQKIGESKGNEILKVEIPYPIHDENEILTQLESAIRPNTTIALIDYITSASAIIFPIKKIIDLFHSKNIQVIVDAAHVPGMIDCDIDDLNADYLIANCHKWICSPKGSAFVYVHPRHQSRFKPVFYSFFNDLDLDSDRHWSNQFIWEGTKDYSAYLSVKDAIRYLPTLHSECWSGIMQHNRELAYRGARLIADKLQVDLAAPREMLGSIINIPVWHDRVPERFFNYYSDLKNVLMDTYKIEVPCMLFPSAPIQNVRISAQIYNSIDQYEYLADCLVKEKNKL